MWNLLRNISTSLTTLIYPHCCTACGTNNLPAADGICSYCLQHLPLTGFMQQPDNPVARVFWGRLSLENATALVWFQKHSAVQQIMHGIKYQARKDAAFQIGRWMGHQLQDCSWLQQIDYLVPLPLHKNRLLTRGYNQAACICEGIARVCDLPILSTVAQRSSATVTQTQQHRKARWENMKQVFSINPDLPLNYKHLLLVDDVITTGASLDALGQQLRHIPGIRLSVCCFAYTVPH
ncbi:MAG TPA: ComF family protein [Flavihumibacter sp.]|nr:ComF family protein [Flavihumibacter sp.]HQD09906.1 ComF family protein [Flavihumibacter sp.]